MRINIRKTKFISTSILYLGIITMCIFCTKQGYAISASYALGHNYNIHLTYKNAPVKVITDAITKQTGVVFSYEKEIGNQSIEKVSISSSDEPLKEVLDKVFLNTGITYYVANNVVALNKSQSSKATAEPNQNTITGLVKDEKGEPLIGVNILIKGTSSGTITDIDGKFSLKASPKDVLSFVYLGYKTQEVKINNRKNLEVTMVEDTKALDEVVIVGYGTQARRTLTSAISKVDGAKLENIPVMSVGDGLKGKVSGLHIASTDGQPGTNPTFLIRGGSSISQSNNPIIMVDGVQRDLTGINPNDIESIEVLKDAASAGIYGARASNGVVLVTTKKGSASRGPIISFQAQVGYQDPATKFDLMGAGEYIQTIRPALAESYFPSALWSAESAGIGNNEYSIWTTRYLGEDESIPAGWGSIKDPIDPEKTIIFQDTDQQKKWFGHSVWQNYYIGVNGGNDVMSYATSVGYTDDGGIGISTGYNRFTVHGNAAYKVTKQFKVSSTFDYAQTDMNDFIGNKRNSVIRGLSIPNTHRDYQPDGTPSLGPNKTTMSAIFYDKYYLRDNIEKRSSVNVNLDWNIFDGLSAVAQLSNHNRHYRRSTFIKGNALTQAREVTERYTETNRIDFQTYLNYTKSIREKHNVEIVAGYDYMYDKANGLYAKTTGAVSDKVPTLQAGPISSAGYPESTKTREGLISFFGRANYNYLEKYIFSFTMRADGSSKFAKDNRWGYFPAGSVGWVVSQEPFWEDLSNTINTFKLRGSYGYTGNNGIGLYDTYGSYNTSNVYNNHSVTTMGDMPNEGLTWEKTEQYDLGVDLGFFNNRLRINADYYNKTTSNLLFDVTLPNTTGYGSAIGNIGKVRFYGAEFELSSINIKSKNFTWNTDLTYSYNMNKVLKLPKNDFDKNRIGGISLGDGTKYGGIAEGERLGRIYGYKVAYIIETQAQADAAMYDDSAFGYRRSDQLNSKSDPTLKGRKDIGDYEWVNRPGSTKDKNGKDIINSEDQFLMGYALPHSTGGINNVFKYKNLSLSIYFDYAIGHTINNSLQMRYFMATMGNCNYNLTKDVHKTWKKPGDNTKYARFTANDADWGNRNFSRASNIFCQKGDYLCLRDVTLSYSLPKNLIKHLSMSDLTLSISGNTLFYWTEVTGISPEAVTSYDGGSLYSVIDSYNTEYNPYPPTRKILFSAKIVF